MSPWAVIEAALFILPLMKEQLNIDAGYIFGNFANSIIGKTETFKVRISIAEGEEKVP